MDLRLVLDTNAYVAMRRGSVGILDTLEMADFLGLPSIVLGEFYAGFLIGDKAERNMRERGRPIPTNDIWIAACTLCADARLLTPNAHFAVVPGLIAMGWQEKR